MSVRVLAFFDTLFQTSTELRPLTGGDPWRRLREARPVSRQHAALNTPSTLGFYDLSDLAQAGRVVGLARDAGIDGFVIDCQRAAGRYVTGAMALAPFCRNGFSIAWRWRNGSDDDWTAAMGLDRRANCLRELIGALSASGCPAVTVADRPMLIVDAPSALDDIKDTIALLRQEAAHAGLPGLYIVANETQDDGRFISGGFDALIDPGPAEWQSCQPNNRPGGYEFLEVMAGLRDSVECLDKFFSYIAVTVTRMHRRSHRGKVLPRVFPSFSNWPGHPDGGASHLINTGNRPFDPQLFGYFVENAMTYCYEQFAPDERFIFLQSWNGWLEGSQVEPSQLDGDLVYNALRDAIDRGRYVLRSRDVLHETPSSSDIARRVHLLCEAVRYL